MAKLWLPIKEPTTQRETILYIPGASRMDKTRLQEIIAAQTEKILAEARAQGPRPQPRYPKSEVALAIKDFRRFLDRKAATGNSRRFH